MNDGRWGIIAQLMISLISDEELIKQADQLYIKRINDKRRLMESIGTCHNEAIE
jgi:hypothetical protein